MHQAFRDLIAFEQACGHELTPGPPACVEQPKRALRRRLHQEEFDELDAAMLAGDLPEIADGLADLCYVLVGTAVNYGIDLPAIWNAVHEANLAKFGPGSHRDETGKIGKPPGWKHPDIADLLANQKPIAETYRRWEDSIE